MLAKAIMLRYTTNCCDMIAMKREVAAYMEKDAGQVFRGANVKLGNWRQVTVLLEYLFHPNFILENSRAETEIWCVVKQTGSI